VYVYLDESGDTGFRLSQGSSRFFAIALLVVDDPGPLEVTLAALRAHTRMPNYEFKFAQSDDARRRQFFHAIRDEHYEAHCQVVDKQELLKHRAVLPGVPFSGSTLWSSGAAGTAGDRRWACRCHVGD